MNCKQAETLVAAHADGEVDALRNYSIKKHLVGCARCAASYRSMLELRARIRAEVPYFVASPALHARVRATVGAVRASVPLRSRPTKPSICSEWRRPRREHGVSTPTPTSRRWSALHLSR